MNLTMTMTMNANGRSALSPRDHDAPARVHPADHNRRPLVVSTADLRRRKRRRVAAAQLRAQLARGGW